MLRSERTSAAELAVAWMGQPRHAVLHPLTSVKKLTIPQIMMTQQSIYSWLHFRRDSQPAPNRNMMSMMNAYAMKLDPMMKCARHWPKCSPKQKPTMC